MSSLNYILPVGSMTLTDQKAYRMQAVAAGIERAGQKGIGNIADEISGVGGVDNKDARVAAILRYLYEGSFPRSIDVREMQPVLDVPGVANDRWETQVVAAAGAVYTVFNLAVVAPVMAANRLAVFYGVGVETAPMPVSRLIFRSGGAAGNIIGIFDLEQLANRLETQGFLSEPVVIDPTATYAVQVLGRIAIAAFARVQLAALVFEPAGTTIA